MQSESPRGGSGVPPTAWLVGIGLLGVVAMLFWMGEPIEPPLSRGQAAPEFTLPQLSDGTSLGLEELRGQVVLVNFWATWCKPCEDEMPAMESLYNAFSTDGFALLAIAVDENVEDVREFREKLGITFPILLDPDQRVSRLYQTTGYPESILVDPAGEIVERYVGPREWDDPDYLERVRRLLDQPN